MIKGTITFLDDTPALAITIGLGEDVKAPREIAALEKQGYVFNDDLVAYYKAWLAGKRQGDISKESRFDEWAEGVAEIDLRPSIKQIQQSVAMGRLTDEEGTRLIEYWQAEQGEAQAPLAS